jgi:probable rRNA maturation factor
VADPDSRLEVTVTNGAGRAVRAHGLAAWLRRVAPTAARGDVSIALVTDARIRALNRAYRGKDKPTNVLSFAALDGERPRPGMPWLLGDVVLSSGVIAREAKKQGKNLEHHLTHLAVHGVLHLLGYDHEQDRDAEAMEALEIAALARMGIANPYELRR